MAWLPDGEKNFEDIFIRFGATHERDGQTDGHRVTAIAAVCIASHGKNARAFFDRPITTGRTTHGRTSETNAYLVVKAGQLKV